MMRKRFCSLLVVGFWVMFVIAMGLETGYAQTYSTKNKKAIEQYNLADNFRVRGQYVEATAALKDALNRDKNFYEAWFRLGLIEKMQRQNQTALQYFEKALELTRDIRWQKSITFELAETSLRLAQYDKALRYASFYLENEQVSKPKMAQVLLWKRSAEFAIANRKEIPFTQAPLSDTVNRFHMQYFPVLTGDEEELVFTRRLGYDEQYDEDLVVARKKNRHWTEPVSISPKINSRFNEGTCTISADGRLLIFTSCQGRRGYGSCDLFASQKVGDDWSDPVNMGPQVNSPAWESQPSLSADGRILFFVSDRRGGIGGRDIYRSFKQDENTWTRAENIGTMINTPLDEISPFIHANGTTLFFATNGRPGFGGYDIFRSEWADSLWTSPANFGYPVNNQDDQFSLFITPDGTKGYYSHEETDRYSTSRIFQFSVPEEFGLKHRSNVVKGVVRNRANGLPVKAHIELINLATNDRVSLVDSDSITGRYLMVLTEGADYGLYASATGFLFQNLHFNYEADYHPEPLEINIDLDPVLAGARIVLNNIFFDVDKYDLKPKSQTELDKLARFLEENPKHRVEISGHTDNTGTEAHNQTLSAKRAQSVSDYLVSKGVDAKRLARNGYGSTRPIAPNDSDENKQKNRRIEFKILD